MGELIRWVSARGGLSYCLVRLSITQSTYLEIKRPPSLVLRYRGASGGSSAGRATAWRERGRAAVGSAGRGRAAVSWEPTAWAGAEARGGVALGVRATWSPWRVKLLLLLGRLPKELGLGVTAPRRREGRAFRQREQRGQRPAEAVPGLHLPHQNRVWGTALFEVRGQGEAQALGWGC